MATKTPPVKEAAVKTAVKRLLVEHGVYYFMPLGAGYGRAGIPDFVCCVKGQFLAIECKAGKGKTTALQDRELESIRAAWGTALVINENNMGDLSAAIDLLQCSGEHLHNDF